MKSYWKSIVVLVLAFTGSIIGVRYYLVEHHENSKKEAYIEFINNHPYANRNITLDELAKMPKFDRPDLAAEQNFLQTLDPNLKEVPTERLLPAYEYTKNKLHKRTLEKEINNANPTKRRIDFKKDQTELQGNNAVLDAIPDVNWTERGPNNVGGRTRAVMWDPNDPETKKLWAAGVAGGIWFNNDGTDQNSSWQIVDDFLANMAISTLTYDPSNTQVFYAGTGEGYFNGDAVRGAGIFKSTDGGASWTQLPSTLTQEFHYVQKIIVTSAGTILAATRGGGLQRSTDNGESWTTVLDRFSGANTTRANDLDTAANGDIYATMGIFSSGTIHRSSDDGATWTDVSPNDGSSPERIEVAIAPSASAATESTVLYALASNGSNVEWFQKSENGGTSWTSLPIPEYRGFNCNTDGTDFTRGQAWYDLTIDVAPDNPDVVIAGGINVLRSDDGGNNMSEISYWVGSDDSFFCDDYVHADIHTIAFRPGFPNEAVIGSDGGISYSPDIGTSSDPTFDTHNNNYAVTQFYAMALRNESGSGNFIAGSQDNGTQRFTDAGGLTTIQAVGGDGTFCHIDQANGDFQIASVQFNSVRHSSDGGLSFRTLTDQNEAHSFINPTDLDNQSHILYTAAAVNEYMLIRNINTANPSSEEFVSVNGIGNISHINANSTIQNRLYIGTRQGNIFIIDNANTNDPSVTNITSNITAAGNVSSVEIGTTDSQLIATFSNYGVSSVWLSLDEGSTWINKDATDHGLPDIPVRWALFNPNNTNQVMLATELGVWSTSDISADNPNWEPTSNNLANVRCDMLQYRNSDGLVSVATHGRGVFTTDAFSNSEDTEPPVTVLLSPADDELEVLLDKSLEITFNEPIQLASGSITIHNTLNETIIERIEIDPLESNSSNLTVTNSTLTIDPSSNLPASSRIHITISEGAITDLSGNSFAGIDDSRTWNFETFDGDIAPVVSQPLGSIRIIRDQSSIVEKEVDLTGTITDEDNDDNLITYQIISNSNPSLLGVSFSGTVMTLSAISPGEVGKIDLTLEASSNGKTVNDEFAVIIGDALLYNQTDNQEETAIISMLMTDQNDTLVQLADDFTITGGEAYQLTAINVLGRMSNPEEGLTNTTINSFIVEVYGDAGNGPEDSELIHSEQVNRAFLPDQLDLRIPLEMEPIGAGTYWVSVYSVSPFATARWNWVARAATNEELSINDRLGFFGLRPNTWLTATSVGLDGLDLAFSLEGSLLEDTESPTNLTSVLGNGQVELSWIDNSTNSTGFIIERSQSENEGFEAIGSTDANTTNYTDDNNLLDNTTYFYRIIAVGPEINSTPSNVASVIYEKPLGEVIELQYSVYPNPVTDLLTIDLPNEAIEGLSLVITDLSGRKMYSSEIKNGNQQIILDMSSYQRGIYTIRINGTKFQSQSILIKN